MTAEVDVSLSQQDINDLNRTNILRVNPHTGAVHEAWCRTQEPALRPAVLPWPKFVDESDRPCGICKPDLSEPQVLKPFEWGGTR